MAGRAWLAGSMAVLVDIQVRHGTRCFHKGRNVTGRVGLLESLQWYRMDGWMDGMGVDNLPGSMNLLGQQHHIPPHTQSGA
jgi:hypothetical protein